ncbi:MAG: hypothetical protein Q4F65_12490 [Propionibacteriaceae bacterium]|nr:hypothetical protein [Propionibacteriaceae bacterium]
MTSPRPVLAGVVTALVLSGCSAVAEPGITVAPPTMGVVPEQYRTPEPTPSASASSAPAPSVIPGTNLRAGKTPGTALGPTGVELRFVPADPDAAFECRPPTEAELAAVRHSSVGQTGKVAVVDIAEGWSAVAYFYTYAGGDGKTYRATNDGITDGGKSFQHVGPGWPGSHTYRGIALADGPKAVRTARLCLND